MISCYAGKGASCQPPTLSYVTNVTYVIQVISCYAGKLAFSSTVRKQAGEMLKLKTVAKWPPARRFSSAQGSAQTVRGVCCGVGSGGVDQKESEFCIAGVCETLK